MSTPGQQDAEPVTRSQRTLMVLLAINDEARNRSLQVALMVPLLATLLGLGNSIRMLRLPDIRPSADLDGLDLG